MKFESGTAKNGVFIDLSRLFKGCLKKWKQEESLKHLWTSRILGNVGNENL